MHRAISKKICLNNAMGYLIFSKIYLTMKILDRIKRKFVYIFFRPSTFSNEFIA